MQWVNGMLSTTLPLSDRSIQFGDGVFRTLRKAGGRLLFWEAHYSKLKHDAARLGIVCPAQEVFTADLANISLPDAAIKIILSRGNTARGYAAAPELVVTRIVQAHPLPEGREKWLAEGVKVRFAQWRLSMQPQLAGIKHLNRLDNVMARREWTEPTLLESLMLDQAGRVIEGTMSNLFIVRDKVLITPALTECGVAGVMRDKIIEAAQHLSMQVKLIALTPDMVLQADALMLSNSLWGILPVNQCEKRVWQDFSVCYALHQMIFNNS
jgi:4-amino-4-deoxychorismate lyase